MPDVHNHDGLLAFLLGMILLVLAGVGLTLVADRVSSAGKVRSEIRFQIGQQEEEIRQLKLALKLKRSQLGGSQTSQEEHNERAKLIELSQSAIRSRQEDLSLLKTSLESTISRLDKSFEDYRIEARKLAWGRAIGDSLGNLTTTDGRTFQEAVVVGVNDKGISIRHSNGTSSIPATALAEAYWDIFQWERPESMRWPQAENSAVSQDATVGSSDASNQGAALEDEKDIAPLRTAFRRAGENATRLAKELQKISAMEADSRSSSVPGSLDTWVERKAQLSSELANAKMQYAKARANLMIRSPDDSLLRGWHMPWAF
jgi:hypothetical protein